MEDLADRIRSEELEFYPIGQTDHPRGSLPASLAQLGRLSGWPALRYTVEVIRQTTVMICRDLPNAAREARVDALLVDQTEPAGGSVADVLGLPFITVCNAMVLNRDSYVPPPFAPWKYRKTFWARIRNRLGYSIADRLLSPVSKALAEYRESSKLPPFQAPADAWSKLAQISQQPAEFDFPRMELPANFHYVGPLRDPQSRSNDFPWDRLNGHPLIYASLGTLQNGKEKIFRCFAEACAQLDVQLVIAHGGGLDQHAISSLPGEPLAVSYAPQLEVLKRCSLTLTHAGLNTVLDTLSQGVPAIAIPITYEQPAIAARLEWVGAGCAIPLKRLEPGRLRSSIRRMLEGGAERKAAAGLAKSIQQAGGVARAADIVESALAAGKSTAS
jgi:MGT family glycosyltransferase